MAKTVLAELVTQMTIESEQFKKELEKSTAKTVAFNNKTRQAANDSTLLDKKLVNMARSAAGYAKAVAGAGAALAAATAGLYANASASARNAKELKQLADIAGLSVAEFDAMAFAFGNYNIEQDKFADISKDVQDKVGEFLATGAGPMKDFFEQVAPLVGITAEQFRHLSGPDVLIAVKKAMDDANISAKEQVFYMEALANDASALIPALADGGAQLNQLARDYRALNLTIDETDIEKLKEFDRQTKQMTASFSALGDTMAVKTIPILNEFSEWIEGVSARARAMASGKDNIASLTAELRNLNEVRDERRARGLDLTWIDAQVDEMRNKIKAIQDQAAFEKSASVGVDVILQGVFSNPSESVTNLSREPARQQATAYLEQFKTELAENAETLGVFEAFNQVASNEDLLADYDFSGLMWLQDEEARIKYEHWLKLEEMQRQSAERQKHIQNSLEQNLFNTVASMASNIVGMIEQASSEGSALQKAAFLLQQGILATTTVMNAEAAAAAALAPPPIGLGPVAGLPYSQFIRGIGYASAGFIAGQAIAGSFEGGGYTWDGPRTGGMDGRGGRLAMLHPQETVIDHTKQGSAPAAAAPVSVVISPQLNDTTAWDQWYTRNRNRIIRDIRSAGRV